MFDFARQGYSYSQTPDEAKVGSSYITSGYPDEARSVHAVRVCSSHFTDNVYLDENIMEVQLGLTQKRNELKLDAVPTVFHEQSEPATSTLQAVRQGQAQVKDQVLLIKSHPSMKRHQTMIFQNSAFFIQVQEVKRMTSWLLMTSHSYMPRQNNLTAGNEKKKKRSVSGPPKSLCRG
ncbi:uncharacterized protein LOC135376375 isoform X1 [Ornithodoros turicata]|uniref:uncharacterized protein LOC135373266 isoform X1 n=1 Tax=Ornithodoros turicata TaxID=34597 RepID=UPI0031395E5E